MDLLLPAEPGRAYRELVQTMADEPELSDEDAQLIPTGDFTVSPWGTSLPCSPGVEFIKESPLPARPAPSELATVACFTARLSWHPFESKASAMQDLWQTLLLTAEKGGSRLSQWTIARKTALPRQFPDQGQVSRFQVDGDWSSVVSSKNHWLCPKRPAGQQSAIM